MLQIAELQLPYAQALQVALQCVEVAERYDSGERKSMSPAEPDAKSETMVDLASGLECNIRLAVYSLYHDNQLGKRAEAVRLLLDCGRRSDEPD